MPMGGGRLYAPGELLTAAEIRRALEEHTGAELVPQTPAPATAHVGPARYWRTSRGDVGIISAMSENFCDTCNRVRLSATGELHGCLAHDDAVDLRGPLRAGATDGDILAAVQGALAGKRRGHEFTRQGCGAPRKHMVSIGG
jgi:cyclic pyranopterin phosphate synthase